MDKQKNLPYTIIFTNSHWDHSYSSPSYSLAVEFSKRSPTFFIGNPITLKDVITGINSKFISSRLMALLFGYRPYVPLAKNLMGLVLPVIFPINWIPKGRVYNFFHRINSAIIYGAIKRMIRQYDLNDFIFINSFNPFYCQNLPNGITPKKFIYQSIDDLTESIYHTRHGVEAQKKIIENADVVIATSTQLCSLLSTETKKVALVANAYDENIFSISKTYKLPNELKNIDIPIIGYTGNFYIRMDYDLLYKIAIRHSDKILLIIGPRNDKGLHNYNFEKLPNVLFLGSKPIHELPQYLEYMDCALIPFKCNKLTESIYPLKINEYLGMGKSVVSTRFSKDIDRFGEFIHLSDTHQDFLDNIDRALADDSLEETQKRHAFALQNRWENRVNEIYRLSGIVPHHIEAKPLTLRGSKSEDGDRSYAELLKHEK